MTPAVGTLWRGSFGLARIVNSTTSDTVHFAYLGTDKPVCTVAVGAFLKHWRPEPEEAPEEEAT